MQGTVLLPISVLGNDPLPREPHRLAHFQTPQPLTTHSDFGFPARPQIYPHPHPQAPCLPTRCSSGKHLLALDLFLHHLFLHHLHPFL